MRNNTDEKYQRNKKILIISLYQIHCWAHQLKLMLMKRINIKIICLNLGDVASYYKIIKI